MIDANYFIENFCRDLCDTIDKYGRGWIQAIDSRGDIIDSLQFWELDNDIISEDQSNEILDAYSNFIKTLDKVYNEIK